MEKDIIKRANAYVGHPYEIDESCSVTKARDAYIDGATEQKAIDIDKACEWMMNFKNAVGEFPLYDYVGNFRKAMEEE